MTYNDPKKMQGRDALSWVRGLILALGALEALLLARLLARLLAARPDNPSFALLYRLTDPFVAPLGFFNYGQPLFGAVLELSTLAAALLLPTLGYVAWIMLSRYATGNRRQSS